MAADCSKSESYLILKELRYTLSYYNKTHFRNIAVGLAAPQIGILKRVFVATINNRLLNFVNPYVICKSDEVQYSVEGCLSIPGIRIKTIRPQWIKVSCSNFDQPLLFGGLSSVIICHEIDHISNPVKLITDFRVNL